MNKPFINLNELEFTDIEENGFYTSVALVQRRHRRGQLGYNLTELPPGCLAVSIPLAPRGRECSSSWKARARLRYGNQTLPDRQPRCHRLPHRRARLPPDHQYRLHAAALFVAIDHGRCGSVRSTGLGQGGLICQRTDAPKLRMLVRSESGVDYYDRGVHRATTAEGLTTIGSRRCGYGLTSPHQTLYLVRCFAVFVQKAAPDLVCSAYPAISQNTPAYRIQTPRVHWTGADRTLHAPLVPSRDNACRCGLACRTMRRCGHGPKNRSAAHCRTWPRLALRRRTGEHRRVLHVLVVDLGVVGYRIRRAIFISRAGTVWNRCAGRSRSATTHAPSFSDAQNSSRVFSRSNQWKAWPARMKSIECASAAAWLRRIAQVGEARVVSQIVFRRLAHVRIRLQTDDRFTVVEERVS